MQRSAAGDKGLVADLRDYPVERADLDQVVNLLLRPIDLFADRCGTQTKSDSGLASLATVGAADSFSTCSLMMLWDMAQLRFRCCANKCRCLKCCRGKLLASNLT